MMNVINKWKSEFDQRNIYSVPKRGPFYDLAKNYLPDNKDAIVVDVGPGEGWFATHCELKKFRNHKLLDINESTVNQLTKKGFNAEHYCAPERLPFADVSVDYIHLSHIVEHLPYQEIYGLLKEMDRVLEGGGMVVISTPMLWDRFYDDLSHVKPYNPQVFINYLTRSKENATQSPVSTNFIMRELQFRFRAVDATEWGSRYFIVDILMRSFRILRSRLGFRRYIKNGYTMVLEKNG